MKIGYARISTHEQNIDLQIDALKIEGCKKIIRDTMSGAKEERKGLNAILKMIKDGDTIVVWKLDRMGRSLKHLIEIVTKLEGKKCYFKSISENIDTTSPGGRLIFHIFGALAEFERDVIRERTMAGLSSARARGRVGGRPKIMTAKKATLAKIMHADTSNSIEDICNTLDISKSTLYRYIDGKK